MPTRTRLRASGPCCAGASAASTTASRPSTFSRTWTSTPSATTTAPPGIAGCSARCLIGWRRLPGLRGLDRLTQAPEEPLARRDGDFEPRLGALYLVVGSDDRFPLRHLSLI